jgi:hypothetical protein
VGAIVTQQEVEYFLSTAIVRSTYDDDNDGGIDTASLALIIETSEGLFLAHVRGIIPVPLALPIDAFAKHVVLSIIHCQSIKRFPEVFRKGLTVCADVAELLKQIRTGELQIGGQVPITDNGGPTAYSLPNRYLRERDFHVALTSDGFEYADADDD